MVVALAILGVWQFGHTSQTAAQPLVEIGFDMNPGAAPANTCSGVGTGCTLGSIDTCVAVPLYGGPITFDVYLDDLPSGESILGFGYHFDEKHGSPVGTIIARDEQTSGINITEDDPLSSTMSMSDPLGPVISYDASIADMGNAEWNPPYTGGTLGRYEVDVSGTAQGLYGLTLDTIKLGNDGSENLCVSYGCDVKDANQGYGLIAVGVACPLTADLKITSQQILAANCIDPAPTQIDVSVDTDICVRKVVHNNGLQVLVPAMIAKTATAPFGCTIIPTDDVVLVDLTQSVDLVHEEIFTIHCDAPSTHGPFVIENEVTSTDQYIPDPETGNNSAVSELTVAAIAYSDVKEMMFYPSILPDPKDPLPFNTVVVSEATPIQMTKVLHNNGTWGPVDVLVMPSWGILGYAGAIGDCTLDLVSAPTVQVNDLPVSVDVPIQHDFLLTCGQSTVGQDDDGDTMIDEDAVNMADDDGDGLFDEDSGFYLVIVTFDNEITIKTPHVVDPDLGNNVSVFPPMDPPFYGLPIAVIRPFTPNFEYYATSTGAGVQTPPEPENLCFAAPDFGCKTQAIAEIPAGAPVGVSTAQPLAGSATILGGAPGDFIWTPSPALSLGAKVGFVSFSVDTDLFSPHNCGVAAVAGSMMLENDCLPPTGYAGAAGWPDGYMPDDRCMVDYPDSLASLAPMYVGASAYVSWSSRLDGRVPPPVCSPGATPGSKP